MTDTSKRIDSDGNTLFQVGYESLLPDDNKVYGLQAGTKGKMSAKFVEITGQDVNNQDITVTENGTYTAESGYTGLGEVTVNLPLGTKSATENGTYTASTDNLEGYSEFTVAVPLGTKSITANGTYNASTDEKAGYSSVTVNVQSGITPKADAITLDNSGNISIKEEYLADVFYGCYGNPYTVGSTVQILVEYVGSEGYSYRLQDGATLDYFVDNVDGANFMKSLLDNATWQLDIKTSDSYWDTTTNKSYLYATYSMSGSAINDITITNTSSTNNLDFTSDTLTVVLAELTGAVDTSEAQSGTYEITAVKVLNPAIWATPTA